MDCGKSTLALQVDHNQRRQGRHGLLLTQGDRSAAPLITSRVGLSREATEIAGDTDLRLLVRDRWADGQRVDYLIVDEAQFLTAAQVDQLAELVDESHVDVYAFGLTTDFRARLFPGTQRLLEVADDVQRIQVEVLCWCGLPGLLNARVVDGVMVRSGETVVVADTAPAELPGDDPVQAPAVRYQVLCRRHYVRGRARPHPAPDRGSWPSPDLRTHPSEGDERAADPPPCDDGPLIRRNPSAISVVHLCDSRVRGYAPVAGDRVATDIRTRGRCAMGERSLRGSRLGSVSYETERNTAPIDRQYAEYRCRPATCSRCPSPTTPSSRTPGSASSTVRAAKLVGGAEPAPKKVKPPRTHWDMLLERRSVEDLEEVLAERLDVLRGRRTRAS